MYKTKVKGHGWVQTLSPMTEEEILAQFKVDALIDSKFKHASETVKHKKHILIDGLNHLAVRIAPLDWVDPYA